RGFLAQPRGEGGLELVHSGVLAIGGVADLGVGHRPAHGRRGSRHGVGAQVDASVGAGHGTTVLSALVPTASIDELFIIATRVATDAAALLRERLHETRADVGTKSSATDMVTEVDRAAEALITQSLRTARPDDGIVGEEGANVGGRSGVRWVID